MFFFVISINRRKKTKLVNWEEKHQYPRKMSVRFSAPFRHLDASTIYWPPPRSALTATILRNTLRSRLVNCS